MAELEKPAFDVAAFLAEAGLGRRIVQLAPKQLFFSQGDSADAVFYLQAGRAKVTVVSHAAKEATITLLSAGDFVGEESLAAVHGLRLATATAITDCTALKICRNEMIRVMHEEHDFSDLFLKFHASRRHHIPKMKFRVKNWAEYDAGLRRRGSLTLWVTSEVLDGWRAARRTTPGGQFVYSELAIETGMMLRLAFHLALRQTEGLMASIFVLLGVPLSTPDHSTLSRRARKMESLPKGYILPDGPIHLLIDSTGLKVFGAGEWLQERHGVKARRTWRKLHLAVDAGTGMIMASTLTGNDVGDPSQVASLLDQIEAKIVSVTADGAYDGMPTYDAVAGHGADVRVIIPPDVTAVLSATAGHNPSQRDQHILSIATHGRLGWQKESDYSQRALVETAMGRYKAIIGPRLRARSFSGQQTEAAVGVAILNRMFGAGRPNSVRRLNIAA